MRIYVSNGDFLRKSDEEENLERPKKPDIADDEVIVEVVADPYPEEAAKEIIGGKSIDIALAVGDFAVRQKGEQVDRWIAAGMDVIDHRQKSPPNHQP